MKHLSHGGGKPQTYSVDLTRLPDDSVSGAVVSVVAGYTGTPVEDLRPPTDSIDLDALRLEPIDDTRTGALGPADPPEGTRER